MDTPVLTNHQPCADIACRLEDLSMVMADRGDSERESRESMLSACHDDCFQFK